MLCLPRGARAAAARTAALAPVPAAPLRPPHVAAGPLRLSSGTGAAAAIDQRHWQGGSGDAAAAAAEGRARGEAAFEAVAAYFKLHGGDDYIGEDVSQGEHALQAAALAMSTGEDADVVLAALLHDIGHLHGLHAESGRMGDCGVASHERLGADWLRSLGFAGRVPELVERHVDAKRYLCFREPGYHDRLTEASRTTLRYQGGPMGAEEAAAFEADPLFLPILRMRRWDEAAKVPGLETPTLSSYRPLIVQHVAAASAATR